MPTSTDLLQFAIDGDALGFNDAFSAAMVDRINDRIDDYREVVARNIYGEDDSDDDVGEDEFSDEDTDFEDSDDDLDFSDDDLDIDLDLEGLDADDQNS